MSIDFLDGFDLYLNITGAEQQWGKVGAPVVVTNLGRFAGGTVKCADGDDHIYYTDAANNDYATFGCAFKSDLGAAVRVLAWKDNVGITPGDINASVQVNADGSLTIEGDSGADKGSTASGVIVADTWYYIELKVHRAASGSAEVFVNGVSELSVSSQDFLEGSVNSYFAFGSVGSSDGAITFIDDAYVATDASALPTELGDVRISTLLPNNDTGVSDWTPSAAGSPENAFDLINDNIGTNGDGDTSYISETTINNKSEFEMEDLAESPTSIHAVAVSTRASKTDAGSIGYTSYVESAGTEGAGTEIAPSESSYNISTDVFENDPDTAAAWLEAAVNAIKVGVEVTS